MSFKEVKSDAISRRRKYQIVKYIEDGSQTYILCTQCKTHVTHPDAKVYNNFENVWPSYMWKLLTMYEVKGIYGVRIWEIVPTEWRGWWIRTLKRFVVNIYNEITFHTPSPLFEERTSDRTKWEINMKSYLLNNLKETCNELLMPCVQYPWGYTEYLHKTGSIPLHTILQRYLRRVNTW